MRAQIIQGVFLASATALIALTGAEQSVAAPRNCHARGLGGVYASWSKTAAASGLGSFVVAAPNVARLPGFTWEVTGSPLSVAVQSGEPFHGGNSMKGIYGQADGAQNLNVRIQSNNTPARQPIPQNAVVTIAFNQYTPASGWGFSVIDLDVDQVRIRAKDRFGNVIPVATIASWFEQRFDANPSVNGSNVPAWDANEAAVIGSESSSTRWRSTVEGNLTDTEAGAAWFQPDTSLSELSFEYQSLQSEATPSFHILIGSCKSTYVAPIPTPNPIGDTDGDGIGDTTEDTKDPDNDEVPNYLDLDSDNDRIPDSVEGADDTDGDGTPDYVDGDTDSDGVQDLIERDSNDTTAGETSTDNDFDGIDDGLEPDTFEPVEDSDTDGTPDASDNDSDNDGKSDGDEAFDLDGDGDRDVIPSGEDQNENGVDDAFDDFRTIEQLNGSYDGGSQQAPCTKRQMGSSKADVTKRLDALYARVPSFVSRAVACGGVRRVSLVNDAAAVRRSLATLLNDAYADEELKCPTTVCSRVRRDPTKTRMRRLAGQLARYAVAAKRNAIKVCKPVENPNRQDNRPITADYLRALERAISKLPATVTRCD